MSGWFLMIPYREEAQDKWSGSRQERWVVEHLDENDQLIGVLDGVLNGSLSFNANAVLRCGGSVVVTRKTGEVLGVHLGRDRVRVKLVLGDGSETAWGVFLISSAGEAVEESGSVWDLRLVDKLAVLVEDAVTSTFSLAQGANVVDAVRDLITSTGETSVSVEPSAAVLSSMRVWEAGTSKLEIVNDLLASINYWSLWTDAEGVFQVVPYVAPEARPVSRVFEAGDASIFLPQWSLSSRQTEVPTDVTLVSQAVEGDAPYVAHAFSAELREFFGRTKVVFESGVEAGSQAVLDALAARKLRELTAPLESFGVSHAVVPLWYNDLVSFNGGRGVRLATVTKMDFSFSPGGLCSADWRKVS